MDLPEMQRYALQIASKNSRYGLFSASKNKRLVSLYIHKLHKVKTLVVCPLSLIEGAWMKDIAKFTPEIKAVNLWKIRKLHPKEMKEALESDFCIINYESFKAEYDKLVKAGFKMLICDESASLKNFKSIRTKAVTAFSETVKYCYLLSGAPVPNGIHEYFTQIGMIDPLLWGKSFYKWRLKYFYPGQQERLRKKEYSFRNGTKDGFHPKWVIGAKNTQKLISDIKTVSDI